MKTKEQVAKSMHYQDADKVINGMIEQGWYVLHLAMGGTAMIVVFQRALPEPTYK